MFIWTFLLRITHTIISQSIADSSWITLYNYTSKTEYLPYLLYLTIFCKKMYLQSCFKQVLGEPWPDPCWPTDACSAWGQAVRTENRTWSCDIGSAPVSCWVPRAPWPSPAPGRTTNQRAQVHCTTCLISQCIYSAERHLGSWRQPQAHRHIWGQECRSR